MKILLSNRDLYEYLLTLSSELHKRGSGSSSELVASASRKATGMSTEFLGEARIALRETLQREKEILTPEERRDLLDVLEQLNRALDRR